MTTGRITRCAGRPLLFGGLILLMVSSHYASDPAVAQQTGTTLNQGWSNVLYMGPSGPIASALGWLGGQVSEVIIWDPVNQRWHSYYPSSPQSGDLQTLQFGQVYWFAMQTPSALPGPIADPSPTEVLPGWNNVAYFGPGASGSSLLEQSSVWAWDGGRQRWLHRDPNASGSSDFQSLTPFSAYWLYVPGPTAGIAPPSPTGSAAAAGTVTAASSAKNGCYQFTALQPAMADVDAALTQAGLGNQPSDQQLAAAPERMGPTGDETIQAYVPPTVLRAVGWVESSWHQDTYATARGQTGPTLSAGTCAYGMMQIVTGMTIAGTPTAVQQEIGSDFRSNIAAATQLITQYWNRDASVMPYLGRHDPYVIEDWYFPIWAFNCYGASCSSYGVHNNPDDPTLTWPRPIYNSPQQLSSTTNLSFSDYPYQELVYGLVANPPSSDGHTLWKPIEIQLPPHGSVGFPKPHTVPEPSAHLDDGTALALPATAAAAP